MGIVIFDPVEFKELYPSFSSLTDPQLNNAFSLATMYLANTECSVVSDVAQRKTLLYLLTAHIAKMQYGEYGQKPGGLVGRISSATEGSVSVSAEYAAAAGSAQWYLQTSYGASYWEATARYRVARYVAGPTGVAIPVSVPWLP